MDLPENFLNKIIACILLMMNVASPCDHIERHANYSIGPSNKTHLLQRAGQSVVSLLQDDGHN